MSHRDQSGENSETLSEEEKVKFYESIYIKLYEGLAPGKRKFVDKEVEKMNRQEEYWRINSQD